jgi:type II secretory pathway component PulK
MPAPWVALIIVLWVVMIMLTVVVLGLLRRIQHLQPPRSQPDGRPSAGYCISQLVMWNVRKNS